MFRLYKSDENGMPRAYYEVWAEPARRRIVEHWGAVGEAGETEAHRIWLFGGLETQFEKIMAPARAQGFEELPLGAYQTLIVVLTDEEEMPTEQEALTAADHVNEILGWTGLGFCDEDRSLDHRIELTCRVVDAALAKEKLGETAHDDALLSLYTLSFEV